MVLCVRALQHKSPLGAVLGGLGALMGSSWGVLGGLLGVTWATFLALGRSWKGFGSASVAEALPRAVFFEFVLLFGRAEP